MTTAETIQVLRQRVQAYRADMKEGEPKEKCQPVIDELLRLICYFQRRQREERGLPALNLNC